jgi:hypothetical protein
MSEFEIIEVSAANCEACGQESFADELKLVKISNISKPISICKECFQKGHSKSTVTDIIDTIAKITAKKNKPEERLKQIKELINAR